MFPCCNLIKIKIITINNNKHNIIQFSNTLSQEIGVEFQYKSRTRLCTVHL